MKSSLIKSKLEKSSLNGQATEKLVKEVDKNFVTNAPVKFEINPRMLDFLELDELDKNPFDRDSSVGSNLSETAEYADRDHSVEEYEDSSSTAVTKHGHEKGDDESPIVTNTTLNIIRLFGKYIHMLSIFQIIANQVIDYLLQLYNFYFYYIYLDFAHEEVRSLENFVFIEHLLIAFVFLSSSRRLHLYITRIPV